MKRWLSLLLALMLAFSACALAEPADATAIDSSIGNQLGLDVLHQLYLYDQQALFSPVSLTYALAMAAAGARGDTLDELLATLDIDELSLDALGIAADSLNVRGAKSANAAFVSSDIALQDAYLGSLRGRAGRGNFSPFPSWKTQKTKSTPGRGKRPTAWSIRSSRTTWNPICC